jgi:hypothetical protein
MYKVTVIKNKITNVPKVVLPICLIVISEKPEKLNMPEIMESIKNISIQ